MVTNTNYELVTNIESSQLPTVAPVEVGTPTLPSHAVPASMLGGIAGVVKNNYAAIIDPTVNDDTTQGYKKGSQWLNTVSKITFVCVDETTGAAVWKEIGNTTDSQVFSNKTIDGDVNTVQDLGLGTLKTVIGEANNFVSRNGSGVVVASKSVPTGDVLGTSDAQVLTNKTIDDATNFKQIATPATPSAGYNKFYPKTDGKFYYLDPAGSEKAIGGGGGGSAVIWKLPDGISPIEAYVDGFELLDFDPSSNQECYCVLAVPESYIAGNKIVLKHGAFFFASIADSVLFTCETTLLSGSTVLGTYTNKFTSTNTAVTAAVSNQMTAIGDIDLTDATGKINSVSVAAGNKLRVRMFRATSTGTDDARLIKDSFAPKFES